MSPGDTPPTLAELFARDFAKPRRNIQIFIASLMRTTECDHHHMKVIPESKLEMTHKEAEIRLSLESDERAMP
jgi:diadenosine tetraphosphate (Ap4A) HIT family hydrolase